MTNLFLTGFHTSSFADFLRSGNHLWVMFILLVVVIALYVFVEAFTKRAESKAKIALAKAQAQESNNKVQMETYASYAKLLEAKEKEKDAAYQPLLRALISKANLSADDMINIMSEIKTESKENSKDAAVAFLEAVQNDNISAEEFEKLLLDKEEA